MNDIGLYSTRILMKTTQKYSNKYRLLYSSTSYVNNSVQLPYGCVGVCYMQFAGYTNIVCSYVESNSVRLVADDDTTSAVPPTRSGAHEKTYGMRNRR